MRDLAENNARVELENRLRCAFIGHHSWTQRDKEMLFDRKCRSRALKPWEEGYINSSLFHDGFTHIALVEV